MPVWGSRPKLAVVYMPDSVIMLVWKLSEWLLSAALAVISRWLEREGFLPRAWFVCVFGGKKAKGKSQSNCMSVRASTDTENRNPLVWQTRGLTDECGGCSSCGSSQAPFRDSRFFYVAIYPAPHQHPRLHLEGLLWSYAECSGNHTWAWERERRIKAGTYIIHAQCGQSHTHTHTHTHANLLYLERERCPWCFLCDAWSRGDWNLCRSTSSDSSACRAGGAGCGPRTPTGNSRLTPAPKSCCGRSVSTR